MMISTVQFMTDDGQFEVIPKNAYRSELTGVCVCCELQTSHSPGYQECLAVFYELLNVNQFLFVFIKTLEEQKTFSVRDK